MPSSSVCGLLPAFPARFHGSEAHLPLLRWSNGDFVRRGDMQEKLEIAAIAAGRDPVEVGTHSLRIGGATAMYHSVDDLQKVRRFGRWSSDCFHVYLWESHEPMKQVAKAMATDRTELMTPKGAWRRVEAPLKSHD